MDSAGWIQLALYVTALLALTKPMGLHLAWVLDPDRTRKVTSAVPLLRGLERLTYRVLSVDPRREQSWKEYAASMLLFSLFSMLFTYGILRLQNLLPLNPQQLPAVGDALAFNTSASFTSNTNWQSYAGETTVSYFSQMVGLASHNFFSAAVGIAVAAALIRGVARDRSGTLGNFWVDLVRLHFYLLLPICIVYAVFLVSQGMIQNFQPYSVIPTVNSATAAAGPPVQQTIAQGPMASQVAIKMLGTNGGGFVNANAAHPYENPTPFSNFIQMLSIFLIPSGLTYYLGRSVKSSAHGWAVWSAMLLLFLAGVLAAWHFEAAGNPRLAELGLDPATTSFEGKEVRFGVFNSALFATITTCASCGAVNSMHDSFMPLGGLVPLFNIQTGEVIFGGVGAGMYGMLIFVVLSIFIAGLMVGRTPEYLGKKIESYDVKCAVLALLAPSVCILAFTAWGAISDWGTAGLNNGGPHGFSEILYAYSSGAGNNGSAFAGLTCTPASGDRHWNLTLGLDMLFGRFFMIIPLLALGGHLARKKLLPQSAGSFPVGGPTFAFLLIGTVLLVGALTFLPALAFGPIVEHFVMRGSSLTY